MLELGILQYSTRIPKNSTLQYSFYEVTHRQPAFQAFPWSTAGTFPGTIFLNETDRSRQRQSWIAALRLIDLPAESTYICPRLDAGIA